MSRILHAALPGDWAAGRRSGSYTVSSRDRTLAAEGFIHASTPNQMVGVLAAFYSDLTAVRLLVLDVESLEAAGSPVRWEAVPGQSEPFPHIYGPVPTTTVGQGNPVVATLLVERTTDQELAPARPCGVRPRDRPLTRCQRRRLRARQQGVCQWRRSVTSSIPSAGQVTRCETPGGISCWQPGHR